MAPDFDREPLGVIAGGGALPVIVAQHAAEAGWSPLIVAVGDGRQHDWSAFTHADISWNRVGDAMAYLRSHKVRRLVLCGTISVRPDFRSMVPSLRTLALLPEILRLMRGGDDTLLRACARAFGRRGFEVVGVHEIVPELLMPDGLLTARGPSPAEEKALARAFEAAAGLGLLDIGQAVVASAERVIALEGIEGTREMLQRVADLRRRGKIGSKEACVLVKSIKPQQDRRFDLPSIGPSTVAEAAASGLGGIGLTAGGALIIQADEVVAEAERYRLFVVGRNPETTG
ncbi:LpxI family protein [Consotaella aegiceratis]|uniref:LpxI family protein n=1 Tax=Consotaella aegiceratis TaxID=3097961 RepID=UPI002F41B27B